MIWIWMWMWTYVGQIWVVEICLVEYQVKATNSEDDGAGGYGWW